MVERQQVVRHDERGGDRRGSQQPDGDESTTLRRGQGVEWCSGLIVILRRARSANPGAWAGGHASLVPWAVANAPPRSPCPLGELLACSATRPGAGRRGADQPEQAPRGERAAHPLRWGLGHPADQLPREGAEPTGSAPVLFLVQRREPLLVERVDHSRAYCSEAANIAAASAALRPWTEASTIPARRSRTRSRAVRVILTSRCASAGSRAPDEHLRLSCHHHLRRQPPGPRHSRSGRHDYSANLPLRSSSRSVTRLRAGASKRNPDIHPVRVTPQASAGGSLNHHPRRSGGPRCPRRTAAGTHPSTSRTT